MKGNIKGISMVELLISIFMIFNMWTVWILSFIWYLSLVRYSHRIIELHNLDSIFRWFNLRSWHYPNPTDFQNITYSGSLVWKQWTFWDSVTDIIWYSRNIEYPLTWSKYTYSITNNINEFSLAWVLEDSTEIVYKNLFFKKTFAEWIWEKMICFYYMRL